MDDANIVLQSFADKYDAGKHCTGKHCAGNHATGVHSAGNRFTGKPCANNHPARSDSAERETCYGWWTGPISGTLTGLAMP